jgi:hypothetical protein
MNASPAAAAAYRGRQGLASSANVSARLSVARFAVSVIASLVLVQFRNACDQEGDVHDAQHLLDHDRLLA